MTTSPPVSWISTRSAPFTMFSGRSSSGSSLRMCVEMLNGVRPRSVNGYSTRYEFSGIVIESPIETWEANRSLCGAGSAGTSSLYALMWRSDRVIVSLFSPQTCDTESNSSPGKSVSDGKSYSACCF